jgi:transcriptional regulator with XRE-family HTH domain
MLETVNAPPVDQTLIYEHVGREIALQRTSIGLSQADLARAIGLTRSSISNIEKGRQKMLVHTLLEIAASLRVATSSLLPPLKMVEDHAFSGSELSRLERSHISAIVNRIKSPKSEQAR